MVPKVANESNASPLSRENLKPDLCAPEWPWFEGPKETREENMEARFNVLKEESLDSMVFVIRYGSSMKHGTHEKH